MKKLLLAGAILSSCLTFANAEGLNDYVDGVTFSIGQSKDDIDIYRIGLRKDFNSKWLQNKNGYLSGYYELTANYWKYKSENNFGVALSPVFAYYVDLGDIKPYFEAGIGVSYWSKTHIKTRNMSTHFHFEDRIGVGVRYKNFDFSFRYMHYSNAGIKNPNPGIDIFIGSISYKF
jgi:lipid A 3-O-deacylase